MKPRFMTVAATLWLVLASWACAPEPVPDTRPNIIFVISDDQGWNDIGYHGSEILTPNLDRLADGGVRLEHHYVNPACSPTRAALMTGRFASRFGILGAIGGTSKQCLPVDVMTLPRLLSACGYETHISGKWHLSLTKDLGPTKYGFRSSYGYIHGQIDPYTHRYKFGDRTWHRNDELLEEEGHVTDLITDDVIRFIRSGTQPFFLYIAYSVPHYPLAEPKRWTDIYEGKIEERSRKLFAASLSHMDEGIGRIVRELDQAGIRENTVIVYSSDNGGQDNWLNTEGLYDGRFPPDPVLGNNQPLRGWKTQLYEGGVRVPALVNWPGTLSPGEMNSPMHIVDWLPTLAGLAGCSESLPENLDGADVWESVTGSGTSQGPRQFYTKSTRGSSIHHGGWKLIEHNSGKVELFHLAEDPQEENELSEAEPERVRELRDRLRKQREMDGEASYWDDMAP
jgi:arylsulfatase A-like enzyme